MTSLAGARSSDGLSRRAGFAIMSARRPMGGIAMARAQTRAVLAAFLLIAPLVLPGRALGLVDDKLKALDAALKAGDKAKATATVKEIEGEGVTKKPVVEALLKYGVAVEDAVFYDACVAALSKAKDEARKTLAESLKKGKQTSERVLAADALAFAADDEAIGLLGAALLEDKERAVEVSCVRGLANAKKKAGVEPLIKFVEKYEKTKNLEAVEEGKTALSKITGSKFDSAQDWRDWWNTNKDKFDTAAPPAAAEGKTVSRGSKLFGTEVRSSNVVVALDVSSSMRVIDLEKPEADGKTWREPPGSGKTDHPDSRMAHARKALVEFVQGLSAGTNFDLIAFADDALPWQKDGKLVPATNENKAAAVEWISKMEMGPATRTDRALEEIFKHQGIDSAYILSDGIPEKDHKPIPTDEILEKAKDLNRTRKIAIHTMGFPGTTHKEFLGKLASDNSGTYKDIR